MNRLISFLFFANVYIALACVAQVALTAIRISEPVPWEYYVFCFCSTFVIYNGQRLFLHRARKDAVSLRQVWIHRNRFLLAFLSLVSALVLTVTFILRLQEIFTWMAALFLVCIAYFAPFIRLRKIFLLKNVLISFVWTCVTVFIPASLIKESGQDIFLMGVERFFYVLPLAILFDLRDMESDRQKGAFTVPLAGGIFLTRLLSYLSVGLYFAALIWHFINPGMPLMDFFALFASGFILAWVIRISNEKRGELFYIGLIDGLFFLQYFLVLAGHLIQG